MTHAGRIERRVGIWSAEVFADSVSVAPGGRTVYFSGMGAEDPEDGHIHHPGDFNAQCRYSYEKIRAALAREGASMEHIVKVTTYVLDASYRQASTVSRKEAFGITPLPTHTFIVVAGLAWPDMLVEVDVTAVVPT